MLEEGIAAVMDEVAQYRPAAILDCVAKLSLDHDPIKLNRIMV
jgi:hypothetical protein